MMTSGGTTEKIQNAVIKNSNSFDLGFFVGYSVTDTLVTFRDKSEPPLDRVPAGVLVFADEQLWAEYALAFRRAQETVNDVSEST